MSATPFFHVLKTQQFDRILLDELCELTTAIRRLAKSHDGLLFLRSLLSEKRAMLYFTQPSTRTFLSFNNACQILGIQTSEIRDAATSSEIKGESLLDSLRTFSSYVDVIIMRSPIARLAESCAYLMNDLEATLLANVITLTPGSFSVDLSSDRKVLYVHVMDVDL
jgi:aspartate carbamoyltransferase catalytic subunit